jgi:hypothetical protein
MKNQTMQGSTKTATPTIKVGTTTHTNSATVREIHNDGVLIGFHGAAETTKISFKDAESLFL